MNKGEVILLKSWKEKKLGAKNVLMQEELEKLGTGDILRESNRLRQGLINDPFDTNRINRSLLLLKEFKRRLAKEHFEQASDISKMIDQLNSRNLPVI